MLMAFTGVNVQEERVTFHVTWYLKSRWRIMKSRGSC